MNAIRTARVGESLFVPTIKGVDEGDDDHSGDAGRAPHDSRFDPAVLYEQRLPFAWQVVAAVELHAWAPISFNTASTMSKVVAAMNGSRHAR